ncbi:MAG TPA: hypothetical protein IAB38_04280 [Candidatus Onthousia excrementipullorum]|uniref:Uncharacterized protein n=1 Tax=Candidatus Onthousia excrementipullorum TaxID=2840884 RepID=A0A9D1DUE8_9FIRM|nr:hypothetical protein [Candidatus Onthousia excrementipullorum]
MDDRTMITELSNMTLPTFIRKFNLMTLDEKTKLLNNPYLDELNEVIFSSLFLQVQNMTEVRELLNSKKIFHKVLTSPKNKKKRNILNIIGEENLPLLKYIFESDYILDYKEQFLDYIDSIDYEQFRKVLENINLTKLYHLFFKENNIEELENIIGISSLNKDISSSFFQKVKMNILNPLGVLKIKNEKELVLYTKFGLLIEVLEELPEITFKNGVVLPYQNILDVKEGKVNKLISLLKEKGDYLEEDLLEVSLKLYYIFDYDNARNIILDKFTNITPSAINRIIDFNFKDHRREYRTKHQERFYHYGMENEVVDALNNNDYNFFSNLLYDADEEKILWLRDEFLKIVSMNKDNKNLNEALKVKLLELINERESKAKEDYAKDIRKRLSSKTDKKLSVNDLKELFKDVSLVNLLNNYDQDILVRLRQFLLGNLKDNNDCLLRLIINKEALGLNNLLGKLINQYDLIESIAKKNKLSLNSILDVIDIVKTSFFSLKPNEQDIFLSTIANIISSKEYCTGKSEEEILKETCQLHVERKSKVYASIPTIEGESDSFSYRVAPFDAEYLLAAGVDAKNCFRISGKGEDFFRYCLTSNQAVIMYFTNEKTNHTYICPIIRSGNAIHCNGVDPKLPLDERDDFFKAFTKAMNEIIMISSNESIDSERIEVATITNLHLEDYFRENSYLKYQLETYIPIDCPCYTDYNKKDKENYIISKSDDYKDNKYYLAKDKFYQKRKEDYEFNIDKEYDKERLSLIVNSIAYSAIDYKNISPSLKNRAKRTFKLIDVNTFKYIVGNKDWYVAIDDQYNILANLLPYDERAKKEYIKHLAQAPLLIENMEKEEEEYGISRENLSKNK